MHLMQHLFHLIYINKHLSRLTYGRAPAKGSNTVITRKQVYLLPYFESFLLLLIPGTIYICVNFER